MYTLKLNVSDLLTGLALTGLPRRPKGGGIETAWSSCVGLAAGRPKGGRIDPIQTRHKPTKTPKTSDQAPNKQNRSTIPGRPLRFLKSKVGSFALFLISDLNVKNQRKSQELLYNPVTTPLKHQKQAIKHRTNKIVQRSLAGL